MNKTVVSIMVAAGCLVGATSCATAAGSVGSSSAVSQTSGAASTIGSLLEGVFSTSNISIADMAGEWTIDGSAVCFQSENFLKKAGGAAAATAIENKLDPYYKQYGLTGGVITIQTDGTFKLQSKKISLSGNITKESDGNFKFTFTALGSIKIGSMTTYVQKSYNSMDIMFDASKLQSILDIAAKLTGSKLASAATGILGSYDGICVGFGTTKTGTVEGEQSGSGLGGLLNGLFGGGNSSSSQQETQQQEEEQETQENTGLGTLLNILGGKK